MGHLIRRLNENSTSSEMEKEEEYLANYVVQKMKLLGNFEKRLKLYEYILEKNKDNEDLEVINILQEDIKNLKMGIEATTKEINRIKKKLGLFKVENKPQGVTSGKGLPPPEKEVGLKEQFTRLFESLNKRDHDEKNEDLSD